MGRPLYCTQHIWSSAAAGSPHTQHSYQTTGWSLGALARGHHTLNTHGTSGGGEAIQQVNNKPGRYKRFTEIINNVGSFAFNIRLNMQAYPAFPRVRGEGFHGWLEAEGVVALITGVADQHLCVFPWISAAFSKTGHFKELYSF